MELIKAGDIFTHDFSFSQAQVAHFAEVTGDSNPVHLDKEYAATTVFKQPIMHGFLGGSIFSKVFGTLFPGEGTIYLRQEMKFLRPMLVDTEYTAKFTVISVDSEKHRAVVQTQVLEKASQKVTIDGEANVLNNNRL